ncbi:unnamed protein product [Hydatigera taeniaeformis]|uniref:Ig-like domain-containing protein n=1 Tax=Hydatigena taeniaeformis TaxID=6205 RepID=A0A0R3WR34_HYDTA|nr:unnamed protein product [Hydatigera taeniaeformis]
MMTYKNFVLNLVCYCLELNTPRPERCGSIYCHEKARCHGGTCYCEYGYAGDGIAVCEKVEEDLCKRVRCAENAECEAGLCQCKPGFKGDGFSECTPVEVDSSSCNGQYCGPKAECRDGVCVCVPGYTGDPYDICTRKRPLSEYENSLFKALRVRTPVATLRVTQTQLAPKVSVTATTASKAMASLTVGLKIPMTSDDYCEECRGNGECAANAQCTYDRQMQHYRCVCDAGFLGDGAIACIPGAVANRTEAAQCRAPCHRFATCDEYDGRCKCRSGFIGNGYTYCDFDCSQCLAEAQCVPESSQCVCPSGYTGDGIRMCRPVTSQGLFTLRILKDSETIRVREGSGPLTLRCVLSGDVRNVQARWLVPGDVGRTDEQATHEGRELWLTVDQPSPKNSGPYVCQASRISDTINVIVEPQQKSIIIILL